MAPRDHAHENATKKREWRQPIDGAFFVTIYFKNNYVKNIYLLLVIKNFKLNFLLKVEFNQSFHRNFEESSEKNPFENMDNSFCQIWDSELTPESFDSFHLEQKNRSGTNSKFRDSCRH
jgi:hypothetical protein